VLTLEVGGFGPIEVAVCNFELLLSYSLTAREKRPILITALLPAISYDPNI